MLLYRANYPSFEALYFVESEQLYYPKKSENKYNCAKSLNIVSSLSDYSETIYKIL